MDWTDEKLDKVVTGLTMSVDEALKRQVGRIVTLESQVWELKKRLDAPGS